MEIRILTALAVGGVLLAAVFITVAAALLYSRFGTGQWEYAGFRPPRGFSGPEPAGK